METEVIFIVMLRLFVRFTTVKQAVKSKIIYHSIIELKSLEARFYTKDILLIHSSTSTFRQALRFKDSFFLCSHLYCWLPLNSSRHNSCKIS